MRRMSDAAKYRSEAATYEALARQISLRTDRARLLEHARALRAKADALEALVTEPEAGEG